VNPTFFDLFRETIKEEMVRKQMSQKDLAEKSKIHYVTISNILRGTKRNVGFDTAEALLDALDADPQKIFPKPEKSA